jgi:hypothetical protein
VGALTLLIASASLHPRRFLDLPRCQLKLTNGDDSDSSSSQPRPRRRAVKAPPVSDDDADDDDSDSGDASENESKDAPETETDESATAAVPSPLVQSATQLPPQRSLMDCPKCFESFARKEGFRRHVAECAVGERSCEAKPSRRSSSSGSDGDDGEEDEPAARRRVGDQSEQEASPRRMEVAQSPRGKFGQ